MRRECRERFPLHRLQRKLLVSDPDMHHGTCVTHVPRCMSGSLIRGGGKTFPAFAAHAPPANLRIWQEAHNRHILEYIRKCLQYSKCFNIRCFYDKIALATIMVRRIQFFSEPAVTHFSEIMSRYMIHFVEWHFNRNSPWKTLQCIQIIRCSKALGVFPGCKMTHSYVW